MLSERGFGNEPESSLVLELEPRTCLRLLWFEVVGARVEMFVRCVEMVN